MSYFESSSNNDQKYKEMAQMARESFEKNILNKRFHQYKRTTPMNNKTETAVNTINKTRFVVSVTNNTPILSYKEIDDIEDTLKMKIPEMTFVNNKISIKYNYTYEYMIDSTTMLDSVKREIDETIKVSNSKHWEKHKEKHNKANISKAQDDDGLNFDWTYTPFDYVGKITYTNDAFQNKHIETISEDKSRIPFKKLAQQIDIKKFDTVLHFEDELNDNGISLSYSRIRVVDTKVKDDSNKEKKIKYTYILTRFFLRVDSVMARVIDLRTYFNLKKPNKIIVQQDVFEKWFEEDKEELNEIDKLKSFESVLENEHVILRNLEKVSEKTKYLTININI
ncbi:uncharacterized protein HGUI_00211 [Hanseniaspora guilliermondii]|uniref:TIP41-like protein n=1 Tax=Hanseniaspora guilliermondii TaxID=56406 RepID=A0A1L0AZ88_9ASCO|nr:uncharacterized protein HGUI_00211 [Hanseniaspora guilliermondii]